MSDFPLVNVGCQKFIPQFYESSFSNEVNHEYLVERLSRECVALVLDEPCQFETSWTTNVKDYKHEQEFRVSNGKENHSSLVFNDYEEINDSITGNRRGTGVFIPRMGIINKNSAPPPPRKGTGVFLVPPIQKTKTGKKNVRNIERISTNMDEGVKINESFQVPSDIILPQEWPY